MDYTWIKKYNAVIDELKYSSYIETIGEYKAVFVFNLYNGKPWYKQYEYEILSLYDGDLNPNNRWTLCDRLYEDRRTKVDDDYAQPGDYNYRAEIDESLINRYFEKTVKLHGYPLPESGIMRPMLTRQVTRY